MVRGDEYRGVVLWSFLQAVNKPAVATRMERIKGLRMVKGLYHTNERAGDLVYRLLFQNSFCLNYPPSPASMLNIIMASTSNVINTYM